MYNVSQNYINTIMSNSVTATWYGTIITNTGTEISLTSQNFVENSSQITSQICTSDFIEIGTTCASSLDLDIFLDYDEINHVYKLNGQTINRYDFFGGTIQLVFRLLYPNGNYEDVPCKTYNIQNAERTADILSLSGYDNMVKFNEPFGATSTGTGYNFLEFACEACNVELGTTVAEFNLFPNGLTAVFIHPDTTNLISTWRDMVGYVASLVGGVAVIGADDKLYIRPYGTIAIRNIPTTWRYNSAVADYDSIYTELTAHCVLTNEDENFYVTPNTGLTYTLGTNPFLQFEIQETRATALTNILNALNAAQYTPFTATTPLDPALECGDVVQLQGGQATEANVSVITKITYSLNGSMSLECVGKNPKILAFESALDKRFDNITVSSSTGDAIHYYEYTNDEEITIGNNQSKRVIIFRYAATKLSRVELFAEVLLHLNTVETTAIVDDQEWYYENSGLLTIKYYKNGILLDEFLPKEEYMDGWHILPIIYQFPTESISLGTFEVFIEMSGASITIDQQQVKAWISGTGLAGENVWDGTINAFDDVVGIRLNHLKRMIYKPEDSIDTLFTVPERNIVEDNVQKLGISRIKRYFNFTENISASADVYSFMSYMNANHVTTTATVSDNKWVGSGSVPEGTSAYIITEQLQANNGIGLDHVTCTSFSAIYLVSFDNGETWNGWADAWVEDYQMTNTVLQSVTSEQWALGGPLVKFKVLLGANTNLSSLNVYGGTIYEEPEAEE